MGFFGSKFLKEQTMKWPAEQYEVLLEAFRQFLDSCGRTKQQIREYYADRPEAVLWDIYRQVRYDLQHDDDHPAYKPGVFEDGTPIRARKRLVSYSPKFVLYPPGCNDTHLKTALRSIGKYHDIYG
jgi:hypothetical protein